MALSGDLVTTSSRHKVAGAEASLARGAPEAVLPALTGNESTLGSMKQALASTVPQRRY